MVLFVGLIIFVSALAIATLAALLVFFADELFMQEIKHIINGRPSEVRNTKRS